MTDTAIARFLIKENFNETFIMLEDTGASLSLNNVINKWFLSIFIQGTSELYSNFIWDLFLLEGNIITFKAVYAVFIILEKHLKKLKSFEALNNAFNKIPLELKQRGKLAYYLIGKKFNFNMDHIKRYRKMLSSQVIKEILDLGMFKCHNKDDEEDKDKTKENEIICDLDWPQCIKDKKNLEIESDLIVFKELEEPYVIEDYIDYYDDYKNGIKIIEYKTNNMNFLNDDDIESKKIQFFKEQRFKDLLIERKKHYCDSNLKSIRSNFIKTITTKDSEIYEIKMKNTMKYINDKDKKENEQERDRRIDRIVTIISKGNQNSISFVKEKIEKNVLLDDDKINV